MELKTPNKPERQNIADIFALTPMQEGMLFHYLKSPESVDYFEQLCLDLSGHIDREAVETAWNVVVKNNEMLRATFRWDGLNEPVQIILETHALNFRYYDLSDRAFSTQGLNGPGLAEALEEIKRADRLKKFDLREVPFRVTLIRVDAGHCRMIVSSHHILYDGWSGGIILKEFFNAYDDLLNRRQPAGTVKTKFKEYVKWLRGRETAKIEHYWRNYLAGLETLNRLPIKNKEAAPETPAPPEENAATGSAYRRQYHPDPETVRQWENFAKHHKITLASLFYCAWGILLHKYCNTTDVIFGAAQSGRSVPLPGIDNMVGLFIETLPLRCRACPTQPVLDLLLRVNRESAAREEHSHIPLVKIKELSPVDSRAELFDSIVILENYPLPAQTGAIQCDSYSMAETTHYDITVTITVSGGVVIHFSYRPGLFDDIVMDRQPGHFSRIIEQITGNPGITESVIDILSPEEKQQILGEFNRTETPYPHDKTIPGIFLEQARRTPDRQALIGPAAASGSLSHITYRELAENSERLAAYLKEKGVAPDTLVAIKMERSLEMIIAIFGILHAGAAYLPIDPAYPEERIDYMLKDSGAKIAISDMADLGTGQNSADLGTGRENHLHLSPAPVTSLAYVIYTSGSTGKPKGVMIDHYSVINRLNWMQRAYPIGEGDVILQKTPVVFDVSVWELFWWSFHSASLCLLAPGEEKSPGAIAEITARQKVTTLHFVPSMLAVFLAHLEENQDIRNLKPLKQVFSSGEALGTHLVKQFKRLLFQGNHTRLINLYGPTEATVDVSYFNCSDGSEFTPEPVPIGKPIDNIRLLILNIYLNVQPIGIPGELCISGVGLARGYLNRPELTAEKFCLRRPGGALFEKTAPPIPPHKNFLLNHSTIYKTGDLARWQPDGNIEFIGRIDHQVKIRGYRIEPGEIRDCILAYPGIKEAAVIAGKTPNGETVLRAYTVGLKDREEDLRKHLCDFLPGYMVPAFIMDIPALPLTVNGKIDRQALPEPCFTGKTGHIPPQTEIEKKLANLWAQLLEIDETRIGSDDNFFRLGGHSLKAVLLVSRIHREFHIKLTLAEIFNHPGIRRLAEVIRAKESEQYIGLEPAPLKPFYPVSSAQKRLFIVQQLNPGNIDYNMNWVFTVTGDLEAEKLERAFNLLLKRHDVLRTGIEMRGIQPVQAIHDFTPQPLEYLTMADEPGEESPGHQRMLELVRRFVRPFDLARPPLLRTRLIKIQERRHILLVDLHHIVTDDVSNRVLLEELLAIYEGKDLPPPRLQYKDYSEWQNRRLSSGEIQNQEEFWRKQFTGGVPQLNLPLDFPRPALPDGRSDTVLTAIDPNLAAKIKKMTLDTTTTPYMLLLAVYCLLLSRRTGETDILVGSAAAGRRHANLENIVGMFVNMLAIRCCPLRHLTFSEFLDQVKTNTLNAFDNQDYPFDNLAEALGVEARPGRNPIFDVEFNLFTYTPGNNRDEPLEAAGLTFTQSLHHHDTLPYDLGLSVRETPDTYSLELGYQVALFKPSTIQELARQYLEILELCLAEPDTLLEKITAPSAPPAPAARETLLTREEVLNFDF